MRTAQLLVELARGRGDAGPVKAGVRVRARLPVDERLDRRERQVARVERDAVAAQHRLRVLISGAPCVAVVRVDGLVARQPDQRPPAEVLERSRPSAGSSAAAGAPRRCFAPDRSAGRALRARCRDVRPSRAGSAPARSVWRRPPARRRRRRRDRSYRAPFQRVRTTAAQGAVVAYGLGCGRLARRGFSGRARALPGGCARRRSARRGRASARARAGSDRRSRRSGSLAPQTKSLGLSSASGRGWVNSRPERGALRPASGRSASSSHRPAGS